MREFLSSLGQGGQFSYWITRGTAALIVVLMVFAGLWYLDQRKSSTLTEAQQDAKLEAERRRRALAIVNDLKSLSMRRSVRLQRKR